MQKRGECGCNGPGGGKAESDHAVAPWLRIGSFMKMEIALALQVAGWRFDPVAGLEGGTSVPILETENAPLWQGVDRLYPGRMLSSQFFTREGKEFGLREF